MTIESPNALRCWRTQPPALAAYTREGPWPAIILHVRRGVLLVGTAVLAGLFAFVGVAVLIQPPEPDLVRDQAKLDQTMNRLRQVRSSLDNIDAPSLRAAPSEIELQGCYIDSGAAGQPWISREWSSPRAIAPTGAREVAAALREIGWEGPAAADRFGGYALARTFAGWTGTASIGDFTDVDDSQRVTVYVTVHVDGAEPCSLR